MLQGRKDVPVLLGLTPDRKAVPMLTLFEDIEDKGLLRIYGGGMGCLLIHRTVLEKIEFRVEEPPKGFDDMYFFRDLQTNRIPAYADTDVRCKHLEEKWSDEVKQS